MSAVGDATPSREPARLAVYLPLLVGGGAERVFLDLAAGLAKLGWSVDLVLADASGPVLADVSPAVDVVDLGAAHASTSLIALVRYLRRSRPAAVLSGLTHANLVVIVAAELARVKTRVVVTEHLHLSTYLAGPTDRRSRLYPSLIRRLYPRADEVVAVSEGVAEDLAARTGLPRAAVRVEKNPIRVGALRAAGREQPSRQWFADGGPPTILSVGRLTRQKDFENLVRAFRAVRDSGPAHLLVLGEGEDREDLERLVAELGLTGDVAMPGFVTDPYPYFARADLFVLSSRWEGLPTVLLEAMVFGLPIVSTDCHSGPREILEDGRLGALVPIEDPTALAAAIKAALPADGETVRVEYPSLADYEVDRVVARYDALLRG
jgi:glycosyltransferase involved in cell wall biosynthesis